MVKKTRHPRASKKYNALLLVEIRVYSRLPLNHPRFPRLMGIDTDEDNPSITLEYMPNGNLSTYLSRNRDTPPNYRAQWVWDVLDAAHALHRTGVFHSNIQPWNFVVDAGLRLRIIAFSGAAVDGNPPPFIERAGFFLERDVEVEGSSAKSDLFAVGSTIYQIVTGVPPYADHGDDEIDEMFARREFPSLDGVLFGEVIGCCWAQGYMWARQALNAVEREIKRVEW